MFRSPLFIWFLIIVVATFSLSIKVAEASISSWLWTLVAAIVTTALVLLTGGAGLAFLGFCPICGAITSFGGLSAASITTGVACGTGLICGGSSDNPFAIVVNAAGSCATDNGIQFYDSDPGSANPNDRVALYRFSNAMNIAGESQVAINFKLANWMTSLAGNDTRTALGSGFYDAGAGMPSAQYAHLADAGGQNCAYYYSGSHCADFYPPARPNRAYIESDSGSYAQYLSGATVEGAPLQLLRYGDVCSATGECRVLDQSASENTYDIYAAKVLRVFPNVNPAGGGAPVALADKFLSVTQGAPVTFPMFPFYLYQSCRSNGGGIEQCRAATGPFYQGAVFAGPFRVGSLDPTSCAIPATPAAIVSAAAVGCNYATLSTTFSNTDSYDVLRDGAVIASGIPADETVYNDTGLTDVTTYQYSIAPHQGSATGNSNVLPVVTTACLTAPSATVTVKSAQCTALTLTVATVNAEKYHVIRDGVPVAADIPAAQTEFTDSGLQQNTRYNYVVRAVGNTGSADSAPLSATTADCRPSCTFGANPDHIVRGETTRLGWSCAKVDECTLDGATVAAPTGTKDVAPTSNTTYTLRCTNPSGSTTTQTTVNVARPGLHEVNP